MTASRVVTAEFFDGIYRAYEKSPNLRVLLRSALDEGLPIEVEPYSFVTMDALREITERLRPAAGELLADLACGRGGPGMWVARSTGARVVGVDFSAVAVAQATARRGAFQLGDRAEFRIGRLEATRLAEAQVDALMCVDSLQFSGVPELVAREAWRILRPGGRAVVTTWEAREKGDPAVPDAYSRLDVGRLLRAAGFTDVEVAERPEWHQRERAVFQRALDTEPGDDPALQQLRSEAGRVIPVMPRVRRVIASAVKGRK
ncbi:class I SAM-dependent methyltransferase [Micromonospora sp. DT228]|uniref:class I SAM-dependent methyltransferase n=1 Tax=Micromonospora sp. DT228 TaxID=3393443 RepID=UPI003CE74209